MCGAGRLTERLHLLLPCVCERSMNFVKDLADLDKKPGEASRREWCTEGCLCMHVCARVLACVNVCVHALAGKRTWGWAGADCIIRQLMGIPAPPTLHTYFAHALARCRGGATVAAGRRGHREREGCRGCVCALCAWVVWVWGAMGARSAMGTGGNYADGFVHCEG